MDFRAAQCKLLVKFARDLRLITILAVVPTLLGSLSAFGAAGAAHPCSEIITGTPQDLETYNIGNLCLAARNPAADRPLYRRSNQGETVRFYINQERLILIVSAMDLSLITEDPELQRIYADRFPDDLLKIWFDDAHHWLRWFEGFDDRWNF